MGSRGRKVMAAAAILLMVAATPVAAQDGNAIWYSGTGFTFDPALGRSVNVARVRAAQETEFSAGDPAHISFTLYGARDEGQRSPVIGRSPEREVRIYDVSDLATDTTAARQVRSLQRLLEERPDPDSFSTVGGPADSDLPWVPPITEAARIVQARVHYIDTPEVSGISYVAFYAQDTVPPTSDDLLWTFQGLSADGATYVSVIWHLTTTALPTEWPDSIFDHIDRDWSKILGNATKQIEDAPPSDFKPNLDSLDGLVASMVFPGGPASAVPEASPAP